MYIYIIIYIWYPSNTDPCSILAGIEGHRNDVNMYISISVCVFQKGCLEWRFKLQQWQSKPQNSGIHAVIHATQNAI